MTEPQAVWSRSPKLAFVDDGERVVLLRLDVLPNQPRLLQGAAAAIWRSLQGPRTTTELLAALRRAGGTGSVTIDELEDFLAGLAGHGLMRCEDGVSP